MGIKFALRSDNANFHARYSKAGKEPGIIQTAPGFITYDADASAIGGHVINMDQGVNVARSLNYPARNLTTSREISVLMRCYFPVASINTGFFDRGSGQANVKNRFSTWHTSANNWVVSVSNALNSAQNVNPLASSVPLTTGAWIDLLWTWIGTNAANGLKLYIDASLIAQAAISGVTLADPLDPNILNYLCFGGGNGATTCRYLLNEAVIWDEVIDPTNVQLTTGMGSLDGAARAAFVECDEFDGTYSTNPGEENVATGISYYINGTEFEGAFEGGGGEDPNHADPADVRALTEYGDGLVGTLVVPSPADTRFGVAVDNTVGTLNVPSAADTRDGVPVDHTTGILKVPAPSDTRAAVEVDDTVGTLIVPAPADTRVGVLVDNAETVGQLDLPPTDKVLATTVFDNGTKVGTYTTPDPDHAPEERVLKDWIYANGEKVGTYEPPDPDHAPEDKVDDGYVYADGTKTGSMRNVSPGVENVAKNVQFTIRNQDFVGTREDITNMIEEAVLEAGLFSAELEVES